MKTHMKCLTFSEHTINKCGIQNMVENLLEIIICEEKLRLRR